MPKASAVTQTTKNSKQTEGTMAKTSGDAVTLLKADHRKVEKLFQQFETAQDDGQKQDLVKQICTELIVHTRLEEELFYRACREKNVESDLLDEAQVEHDGAKVLIGDLLSGEPGEDYYDAKVKTLSEYIKHHVAEEEKPRSGIFAKAQKAGLDMAELGSRLQARKTELMAKSDALTSQPPQPRSFQLQSKEYSMARNSNERDRDERGRFIDDDDRGGNGGGRGGNGGRERDSQGRFASDDDDRSGGRSRGYDDDRGSSRGGRGQGGWFGDSQGHSQASREGWENRGSSRSRDYDDDRGGSQSRGGGRGQGGWFGDSEGHSQASREGWRNSPHEGSGWYGDPEGHSRASREGWRDSPHEGSGWYGDSQGHSQASREGWDDRGGSRYSGRQSSGRDDDDRNQSRGGGRGQGGWFGDPQGHSQASREGWRNR